MQSARCLSCLTRQSVRMSLGRPSRTFATSSRTSSFASDRPATSIPPDQSSSSASGSSGPSAQRASAKPSANRASFSKPGPPPLSAKDQAEFDALLKANQSVGASPAIIAPSSKLEEVAASEEHRDVRRGAKPEFQGEVNPRTGEQGGPKNDPFKASERDWSYAGRVTDF